MLEVLPMLFNFLKKKDVMLSIKLQISLFALFRLGLKPFFYAECSD